MVTAPLAAWGMDNDLQKVTSGKPGETSALPLAPIPYLESMPWMQWKPTAPMLKIDTLLTPGIGFSDIPLNARPPVGPADRGRER